MNSAAEGTDHAMDPQNAAQADAVDANLTEDLIDRVRQALSAGGVQECRMRKTRTTDRVRYIPGAEGYRVYVSPDAPSFMPQSAPVGTRYVAIGVAGNRRIELKRYWSILSAAGMQARIGATALRPTAARVWVESSPWKANALRAPSYAQVVAHIARHGQAVQRDGYTMRCASWLVARERQLPIVVSLALSRDDRLAIVDATGFRLVEPQELANGNKWSALTASGEFLSS